MKKPVATGSLTSGHGYRLSPTGVPLPRNHKGVDYAAPPGTPIYAAGDGTIVKQYESKSYGYYIRIEHDNGFFTAYAHMQAFADGLGIGKMVKKGQIIGSVGSTGRSSGPHLHYELIHNGQFLDPLFESVKPVEVGSASEGKSTLAN
jgi:murein DD-endopeptidase MepM/ murein hydrolase activator NlpD